jgi:hypothetical protein
VQNIEKVLKVRLTLKETPDGLGREERGAAVVEMPSPRHFASKTQSFKPRRRFGAGR